MSIVAELREYRDTWRELTGFFPSAMPITDAEYQHLYYGLLNTCKYGAAGESQVPMFEGVELYFTPDAPLRRAALKAAR